MKKNNFNTHSVRLSLLEVTVFILSFTYGLSRIYFFGKNDLYHYFNVAVQAFGYIALVALIIRRPFKKKFIKYITFVGIILLISFAETRGSGWVRYFLIIIASRNTKFEKIIKPIFNAFATTSLIALLLFITGMSNPGVSRRNAVSLGFGHPNVAALTFITLFFIWICLRNKVDAKTYLVAGLMCICNFFTTKTTTVYVAIILFFIFYYLATFGIKKNNKAIKFIDSGAQLFTFAFTVLLLVLYPLRIYDRFRYQLNILFSWRPYLNYDMYKAYGVSLFGRSIDQSSVRYVYNYQLNMASNQAAGALDNAYLMQMITVGLIPMIILLFVYIRVIGKAWEHKYAALIAAAVVYSFYSFIESGCNEAYYFFPIFYLLTRDNINQEINIKNVRVV